jgi:hypothetical protein
MLLEKGHSIDRVADFVGLKDISTTKAVIDYSEV